MESSGKSIYRELPLFPSAPDNSVLNPQPQQQHQRRQLTVFYNGRICVSDVTELRARAIIMAAMGEIEQMKKRSPVPAAAAAVQSQICGPSVVSSMKRSLDRFLQKRKNRRMAPY